MKNNKKRIIIIMLVVVGIALLCFGSYYIIKYFKNGKSFFQSNNYILEKAGTIDVKTNMIGSATSTAKKNNLLFVSGIGQYNNLYVFNLNNTESIPFDESNKLPLNYTSYAANDESGNIVGYEIYTDTSISGFLSLNNNLFYDKNLSIINISNKYFTVMNEESKYGLYTLEGEKVIDTIYNYIQIIPNSNLLIANKNDKVGVIDTNGNTIIPFDYEPDYFTSLDSGEYTEYKPYTTFSIDNDTYIIIKKHDLYGIINKDNKTIVDFNYSKEESISYSSILKKFYTYQYDNDNYIKAINFYSLEGIKEKTINMSSSGIHDIIGLNNYNDEYFENNMILLQDSQAKEIFYYVDKDMNLQKVESLSYYVEEEVDEEEPYNIYYINNYMYIQNTNDLLKVYDLDGKELLKDSFKYIQINIGSTFKDTYITLCKKEDKTMCGAINLNGETIVNFENTLINSDTKYEEATFKNNDGYFIVNNGKQSSSFKCNSMDNSKIIYVYQNLAVMEENGNRYIYNVNCQKISEIDYWNPLTINDLVIAAYKSTNESNYLYDIYDINGNKINYTNKDGAIFNLYLGEIDNILYFLTDKGIYSLSKE